MPMPLLQHWHKRPRTFPVVWLWSILSRFSVVPQIAQAPFCFSISRSCSSTVRPYPRCSHSLRWYALFLTELISAHFLQAAKCFSRKTGSFLYFSRSLSLLRIICCSLGLYLGRLREYRASCSLWDALYLSLYAFTFSGLARHHATALSRSLVLVTLISGASILIL